PSTNPQTLASSATPGTACRAYRMFQSCSDWSCCRVTCPVLSISAYSKTQPTPVASGPRMGVTPWGNLLEMVESFSSTRLRAQYRSVPSSKMTFTNDMPNIDCPRTAVTRGEPSSDDTTGYVMLSSTRSGARPIHSEKMITWTSERSGIASSAVCRSESTP